MTTTHSANPPGDPCVTCDLSAIDDLSCGAKRIQRQYEVTNESLAQLEDFKAKFTTARTDYGKARDTARTDVTAAGAQLKSVRDQLRCHLGDEQRSCLERALQKVIDEIQACGGEQGGCCAGPCTFDSTCTDQDTEDTLAARISQYRRDTLKNTACFTSLLAEQTALPQRAAKIRADVAQLAADAAADGTKDYLRLFARVLVADHQLQQVWNGFATVDAYVDCLCTALMCILKGWEALVVLEGALAELQCKDAGKAAACARKKEQTVDEVLAAYAKLCPQVDCGS